MNTLKRLLIASFCLCAAIACYLVGVPAGGTLFLLLGVVLEVAFWSMLFRAQTINKMG